MREHEEAIKREFKRLCLLIADRIPELKGEVTTGIPGTRYSIKLMKDMTVIHVFMLDTEIAITGPSSVPAACILSLPTSKGPTLWEEHWDVTLVSLVGLPALRQYAVLEYLAGTIQVEEVAANEESSK